MGMGGGGPAPKDLWILLGVLFFTFTLQFFQATAFLPRLLRLSPEVWQTGFLWKLGTYAFVGYGRANLWFLLSLLIIFWFGRDVCRAMSRKQFWTLMAWGILSASLVATVVQILMHLVGGPGSLAPFGIMQGHRIVLTILIAAFATLYRDATIYLMFILPIQAKWFLGIEILFAFMAFLGGVPDKDLPGFLGICTAVGVTYVLLSGRRPSRILREWRLRLERLILEARLRRTRKGMRVVPGGRGRSGKGNGGVSKGPWVN